MFFIRIVFFWVLEFVNLIKIKFWVKEVVFFKFVIRCNSGGLFRI